MTKTLYNIDLQLLRSLWFTLSALHIIYWYMYMYLPNILVSRHLKNFSENENLTNKNLSKINKQPRTWVIQ